MKKHLQVFWMLIVTIFISFTVIPNLTYAETMDDPAPIILPDSPNGKKVLFDNTHGQTAGQADWVIDGAFSDFAEAIADNGYEVVEFRKNSPMTLEDLEPYDVFVIPEANIPFKTTEQEAMIDYVENGGSIFFISDHYNADRNKNRWDSSEVMNGFRRGAYDNPTKGMFEAEINSEAMQDVESSDWLSDNFGIKFRFNALGTVVANHVVEPAETFGITEGVQEITMHAGSTLAITNPELAKGIVFLPDGLDESDKWGPAVDEGIYHGGGVEEGPYAAISKLEKGKAAFIGDSSPVEDATPKYRNEETGQRKTTYDGFTDADNATLLLNIIDWLADKEDYKDFTETEIPLDDVSPLLDKEIPENTTEPQPEPWTNPQEHYDWFDPSTFAPGSFGSSIDPVSEPEFTLNYNDVLPNNEAFTIEIIAENLAPGQTISGYNLGIYLDGGQQIAKVQNEDGSWPAQYGYSKEFNLEANSEGIASKILTVQVNENASGNANVRLRQGKTNIKTQSALIGEVTNEEPSEPISIKQARELADNRTVEVEGVITTKPGIFGGKGFYLQDETAGIYVFQHADAFEVGDKVKVKGTTTTFQGMKEITDVQGIEVVGKSELPSFQNIQQIDETNQGELVRMEGVIENIQSYWNAFEFDLRNGDQVTRIRVDQRTNFLFEEFTNNFEEGEEVTVSGVGSIFGDTYQLLVTQADDVQKTISNPPIIGDLIDFTSFLITETYQIPVSVNDEDGDLQEVIIELDGKEMNDMIHISPLEFTPGTYELKITAKDEKGNITERTFTIEAQLTTSELDELVEHGEDLEFLDKKMEQRLLKKVNDIQSAKNIRAKQGKWNALTNQIKAQLGKKIKKDYIHFWEVPADF
ncbi:DNA/RNA endonuclease YhcR with UshA esterase domain [Gracilibacillus halotolerans]|uniref:DNA/RNA endonuclease YhcR with UshA esterase domain n=2 Tax=Gracilibacillus halotolerans TaxID=74386 RepID=A0A841RKP1_9BACI|nr:DNA/RNA endonuclease YhcR with UshA esterase domain [Gracilibacillus halotolerans]